MYEKMTRQQHLCNCGDYSGIQIIIITIIIIIFIIIIINDNNPFNGPLSRSIWVSQ